MLTLIEKDHATVEAHTDDGTLTVAPEAFTKATGWGVEPEGLCRGTACVPVAGTGIVTDAGIDVAAFTDRMGQALVIDDARRVAAIGGDPMSRGAGASLADVTLPAVDGSEIDFAGFVGAKTLLIAWASW